MPAPSPIRSLWSSAERFLKERWLGWFEPLLAREPLDPEVVARMAAERILVIRQHDQLGDFLLAVPALRALRERHRQAWIALVVRSYFADVARLVPFVDEVLVVQEDSSRWTAESLREFWGKIRGRWSLAVVLTTVSHSLTSDLLAVLCRANVVVGSAGRPFAGTTRNFFYHVAVPVREGTRHQSERNLDIVAAIGCSTDDLREEIRVPADAARGALRHLSAPGKLNIGFHVGAGKIANRWPAASFARLAALLEERLGARIILFWGPAEAELKEEFLRHWSSSTELVGHPDVARLAAYFQACDAVVCNDTGVMHLAAATGVPTVAMFGPTSPGEWKPVGDHVRALAGRDGLVSAIEPSAVFDEIEKLLRAFPPGSRKG